MCFVHHSIRLFYFLSISTPKLTDDNDNNIDLVNLLEIFQDFHNFVPFLLAGTEHAGVPAGTELLLHINLQAGQHPVKVRTLLCTSDHVIIHHT